MSLRILFVCHPATRMRINSSFFIRCSSMKRGVDLARMQRSGSGFGQGPKTVPQTRNLPSRKRRDAPLSPTPSVLWTLVLPCEATQRLTEANTAVLRLAPTVSAVPDVVRRRLRRGTVDAGCTTPPLRGWGECDNAGCRFSLGRSAW